MYIGKFIMKRIISIMLAFSLMLAPIIAQDLTPTEIIELANKVNNLQTTIVLQESELNNLKLQNGLLYKQSLIDSTLIKKNKTYIEILESNEKVLEKQAKLLSPRWYQTPQMYYVYGILTVGVGIWGVAQLTNNQFSITVNERQ